MKAPRRCDGEPETRAATRFFDLREASFTGPINQDGYADATSERAQILAPPRNEQHRRDRDLPSLRNCPHRKDQTMPTDTEPRYRVIIEQAGGWTGDGEYHPPQLTAYGHQPMSRDEAMAVFNQLTSHPDSWPTVRAGERVLVVDEADYQKRDPR